MISAAYLRVYSPGDPRERSIVSNQWQSGAVRADSHFVWSESDVDDAYKVEWEGRTLVCPRNGRLRMLEGIVAFGTVYPGAVLLPATAVQRAADELQGLKSSGSRARSHILTSPWHVPLRWFSAFDPEDRELYDIGSDVSLRYRTDLGEAVARVSRAVEIIEGAGFDDSLVGLIEDLERWLRGFPKDSMLELDYASVAKQFSAVELAFDESVAQIRASLEALDELDYERAGEKYAEVASRWVYAQALAYVN